MLVKFFQTMRDYRVPCSIREYLDLINAIKHHLAFADLDTFYQISRICLVKDERHFDKFDKAFAHYFEGINRLDEVLMSAKGIPEEWMKSEFERLFSKEELDAIESQGGFDELMKKFRERLEEQEKRHRGGNKMIGTGGTSPFGADGFNPEGMRVQQGRSRHKSAIKVWEKRNYRNLDDDVELGIRNIKVALRRLRKFARQGSAEELDLDDTIHCTANNAGFLDIKLVPERHNSVKVLIFFDIGGTMDPFVKICEELFSAARSEFKHMEAFYFHNCLYESVWKDNRRRGNERTKTWDLLHKFSKDYKVIFIGDAMMAPYEVTHVGGSVEHWNDEAGAVWLARMCDTFSKVAWLNPVPDSQWGWSGSLTAIRDILGDNMFPLTLNGLENAMRHLSR